MDDNYNAEKETAELLRVGQLPKPLRLAAMLEKTMQWPLHGKSADCLREMYELLQRCENEMRYAGWDKLESDNIARNGVYEQVKELLEKTMAEPWEVWQDTKQLVYESKHSSYGRTTYINRGTAGCEICGDVATVLDIDSSDGEYNSLCCCRPCFEKLWEKCA